MPQANPLDAVVEGINDLSLSSHTEDSAEGNASLELNQLSELLFGLTVADDGPDLSNQPSPLFASRGDFQESRRSHIPDQPTLSPDDFFTHLQSTLPGGLAETHSP